MLMLAMLMLAMLMLAMLMLAMLMLAMLVRGAFPYIQCSSYQSTAASA